MRIISGTAKGRTIAAPPGIDVRPTSDRVREAMFNALFSAGAFDSSPSRAVDLFAGSGALGLEALSRGIDHVTFVESSRATAAVVESNLDQLGFRNHGRVVVAAAETWLRGAPGAFDLVLCDPPYRYSDWPGLLELVGSALTPNLIVVESDTAVDLGSTWSVFKTARYASTVVQIARPIRSADEHEFEGV